MVDQFRNIEQLNNRGRKLIKRGFTSIGRQVPPELNKPNLSREDFDRIRSQIETFADPSASNVADIRGGIGFLQQAQFRKDKLETFLQDNPQERKSAGRGTRGPSAATAQVRSREQRIADQKRAFATSIKGSIAQKRAVLEKTRREGAQRQEQIEKAPQEQKRIIEEYIRDNPSGIIQPVSRTRSLQTEISKIKDKLSRSAYMEAFRGGQETAAALREENIKLREQGGIKNIAKAGTNEVMSAAFESLLIAPLFLAGGAAAGAAFAAAPIATTLATGIAAPAIAFSTYKDLQEASQRGEFLTDATKTFIEFGLFARGESLTNNALKDLEKKAQGNILDKVVQEKAKRSLRNLNLKSTARDRANKLINTGINLVNNAKKISDNKRNAIKKIKESLKPNRKVYSFVDEITAKKYTFKNKKDYLTALRGSATARNKAKITSIPLKEEIRLRSTKSRRKILLDRLKREAGIKRGQKTEPVTIQQILRKAQKAERAKTRGDRILLNKQRRLSERYIARARKGKTDVNFQPPSIKTTFEEYLKLLGWEVDTVRGITIAKKTKNSSSKIIKNPSRKITVYPLYSEKGEVVYLNSPQKWKKEFVKILRKKGELSGTPRFDLLKNVEGKYRVGEYEITWKYDNKKIDPKVLKGLKGFANKNQKKIDTLKKDVKQIPTGKGQTAVVVQKTKKIKNNINKQVKELVKEKGKVSKQILVLDRKPTTRTRLNLLAKLKGQLSILVTSLVMIKALKKMVSFITSQRSGSQQKTRIKAAVKTQTPQEIIQVYETVPEEITSTKLDLPVPLITLLTGTAIPFIPGRKPLRNSSSLFDKSSYGFPPSSPSRSSSRQYLVDLQSIIRGIKASAKEKKELLRIGRTFTGIEIRKQV